MDSITDVDSISILCIVCLSKTNRVIDLNEYLYDDQKYVVIKAILEQIMSTKIQNYYPKVICVDCLACLRTALKLKQKFENSAELLKKWLDTHEVSSSIVGDQVNLPSTERLIATENIESKDILIVEEDLKENDYSNISNNWGENISVKLDKEESAAEISDPAKINADCDLSTTDEGCLNEPMVNTPLFPAKCYSPMKRKKIICQYCKKVNYSYANYIKHIKKCSVTCKNCSKRMVNVEKLEQHMLLCKKDGTFECDFCSERFDSIHDKNSHSIDHKNNKNEHICRICDTTFLTSGGLRYHRSTVHDNRLYTCGICHDTFKVKGHYTSHLDTHNKDVSKVICPICGKGFHYRGGLFYHMMVHDNIRNHKCSYCPKKFLTVSGWKRHERIHTDERPYFCSFCAKSFRSSSEVKQHEWRHMGKKPHECIYCKKCFIKPYNLRLHMSSHTGTNPCDMCGKSYLNAQVLKLHMKFKHPTKEGDLELEEDGKENEEEKNEGDYEVPVV